MAIRKRVWGAVAAGVLSLGLVGCAGDGDGDADLGVAAVGNGVATVGFVAVGPEGGWRTANEQAIRDFFTGGFGFDLRYAPAASPSDQQSQLDAFATFVEDEVDVILLTPTEASGWEESLQRAKAADIPVILVDRGVDAAEDLYVTRIAPDNYKVAYAVGAWAVETFPEGASYFVLEGVSGLSVVAERNEGFEALVGAVGTFTKVGAQTASWTTEEGKAVIDAVLAANDNDLDLIFAQNDEMGLGAAQAVKAAGLVPGVDVKIATIDGTTGALEALAAGDLSFVAQYNPFFGDVVLDVVTKTLGGTTVQSNISVDSNTFDSPEAAQAALDAGLGF